LEIKIMEKLTAQYLDKKAKLIKMLELTGKQAGFLQNNEFDENLELVVERQQLMDEIDRIDAAISQTRQLLLNNGTDVYMFEPIVNVQDEINGILKRIIALDDENKETLTKELVVVKHKIKGLKSSKVMQKAYQPARQQSFGFFIDNKK